MNADSRKPVPPFVSEASPYRLLIVEGDDAQAHRIVQAMQQADPQANLLRASSLAQARRLMCQYALGAALVSCEGAGGDCVAFIAAVRAEGLRFPIIVLTRTGHDETAVAALKAGANDCIGREQGDRHLRLLSARIREAMQRHQEVRQREERARQQEQMKLAEALRATVATIKHEINNPLAIISGNAQLLQELARFMDLDEELIKPIRDIEEASLRIAESLDKLSGLREIVLRESTSGDGGLIDLHNA